MQSSMLSPIEALTRNFILPQQPSDPNAGAHETALENFHGLIVGDMALLLESDRLVIEIVDTLPLCRLPNAPPWLHAMANQRGNIIPIFDLSILFDQFNRTSKHTHYLIIAQDQDQFGMVIDRLPEKLELHPNDFIDSKPSTPASLEPYINRVFQKDNRIWLEWDPVGFAEAISNDC